MIRTGKKFSKPEMSRVINGDIVLATEEAPEEKVRLDILMKEVYKSYNRSTLQKFIESGFVTVDGELILKPNTKFPRGVKFDLKVPEIVKNTDLVPEVVSAWAGQTSYGELKRKVAASVSSMLTNFQARLSEISDKEVYELLKDGEKYANEVANAKLLEAQKAFNLR